MSHIDLQQINKDIVEDIKKELRLQGHYLTGALEQSIHEVITETEKDIMLSASAADYLQTLETGIPAAKIQVNSSTLEAMTKYVELRMGYRGSKAQSVAYAILRKQKKEGMPTSSSYQYSKTGERLHAVADSFRQNEERYVNLIDDKVFGTLNNKFKEIKSGTI